VSWNVNFRIGAARAQGELLASLDPPPDLVLLQEVNRHSAATLRDAAGLAWIECAVEVSDREPGETTGPRRGVAIAGRTAPLQHARVLSTAPVPERVLVGAVQVDGTPITVASYHALPGVTWRAKKAVQAVEFAHTLTPLDGLVLFGADANTPKVDAIDFELTRTHWHTGMRKLRGAPGDDVLFGPKKIHGLDDVLRRWLDEHPDEVTALRVSHPQGPLAVSHRTGKRRGFAGIDRRYDAMWVSAGFGVEHVEYLYDKSIDAGSDHALVVADLTF
jgi:endonuclease/exonuclease/phosphatase family metal-dependent hydrolase